MRFLQSSGKQPTIGELRQDLIANVRRDWLDGYRRRLLHHGEEIQLNLAPGLDMLQDLKSHRQDQPKQDLHNILSQKFARRPRHPVDFTKAPAGPSAMGAGGFRRGRAWRGRPNPPGRLEAPQARSPGPIARSCGPSPRPPPRPDGARGPPSTDRSESTVLSVNPPVGSLLYRRKQAERERMAVRYEW